MKTMNTRILIALTIFASANLWGQSGRLPMAHAHGANILVYNDLNGNGLRDGPQEPPLGGWVVHLIGADGTHVHATTGPDGIADFPGGIAPGRLVICEELQEGWSQTEPRASDQFVADCSNHSHGGAISPGPRGYEFDFPTDPIPQPLPFGNNVRPDCVSGSVEGDAHAYGMRADLLGGGLLPANPDVEPTPDSDVGNPNALLAIPNFFDAASPPLLTLLEVSEDGTSSSVTATAKTSIVDLNVPGLPRIQADAVVARSTSSASFTGASSTSAGSKVINLRIDGVPYGDIHHGVSIGVPDPTTGSWFAEVAVLEHVGRGAAAGEPQPDPYGFFSSGLDLNGIHVVVRDLLATPQDESSDIIVAHAASDLRCN